MKAERRHDLETNDLAKKIIQAPDYFKLYGTRIALGVVALAVVLMLVNYRIRTNRENLAEAQRGVSDARSAVQRLASLNTGAAGHAQEVANQRQSLITGASQAIEMVNEKSDDPKLLAQAATIKGDLYWTVANLPELPGAATQPALAVSVKADDALASAEAAYKRVVDGYGDQVMAVATARLGLAAIAENRGQWDEARKQYQAVAADARMPKSFKEEAGTRERLLGQLQKGVYLVQPAGQQEQAATAPAAGAATVPAAGGGATSRPAGK
jgi:hypothetical protein